MRIFKNTWFDRFAQKEGITNDELKDLVQQLEEGNAVTNLGGGVFKLRLAQAGKGKSSGYRIIVFFKSEEKTFYQYGYTKSSQSNIDKKELKMYKRMAKTKLAMSEQELKNAIHAGELIEIEEK